MNFYNLIRKRWHFIAVFSIALVLFFVNYKPGTYLVGWDSLQTELYPFLGVKRALFSVWEEYQSFGLIAGMAHSADLVRAFIIWILSFILPNNIIRYFFNMAMVAVAGVGMLKLLTFAGFDKDKKVFAVLGALFYILNFATVQMMFLPYEAFSVFLGMLPWEIWIFLKIITSEKPSRKNWMIFLLINILSTPQSYTQQLFMVYGLVLGILALGQIINTRKLIILKKSILAFILILAINSFWILPQIYFLKTSEKTVQQAKINQLSTNDVWYSNKDNGSIKNFLTFTGYYYDLLDNNQNPIFSAWKQHRNNEIVTIVIYALSGMCILGFFYKNRYGSSFSILYAFVAVALLNNTPPFNLISDSVHSNSFLSEIFRSPFTRFSIVYALTASYFFSCGTYLIWFYLKKIKNNNIMLTLFGLILTSLIIFQSLPAFKGYYISPAMKVKIPKEYFSVINYFRHVDPNKRIALLPDSTFWGWFQTKWGYDGSGFLWYGIEQPIVSRTFDVWSKQSENYYWEEKNALDAGNINAFEKVLDKYDINYLIFDQSQNPIASSAKSIQYTELASIFAASKKISLVKKWGFISLYKVNHGKKIDNFVGVEKNLPNIGPAIQTTNEDTAYLKFGDYITNPNKNYDVFYPFLDLTTQTRLEKKNWTMGESNSDWYMIGSLPKNQNEYRVLNKTNSIDINLYKDNSSISFILPIYTSIDSQKIVVKFPKIVIDDFNPTKTKISNCGKKGNILSLTKDKKLIISSNGGAIACFGYPDNSLPQEYGYIVKIENRNIKGRKLFFYILDQTNEQSYTEDRLINNTQYYIIGSRYKSGIGYQLSFQNNSYKNIPSVNELDNLNIYLMPYDYLKNLTLVKRSDKNIITAKAQSKFTAQKLQYYLYSVKVQNAKSKNEYLILNQAYHEGWKAYEIQNSKFKIQNSLEITFPFLFGTELRDHTLVNNWENGWGLSNLTMKQFNNETIVVIFWPQYLEYLGFVFLAAALAAVWWLIDSKKL
ncbi:MAG: hypothetical protein M1277_01635 [Patescibacteria group bacterium]|nr:hypothetical protein [Patescibacteria group bacterium]